MCAAITPWNAPLVLLSYKVAAGLAAGCTIVSKPSPETPLEAYILAECIEKAGLPPGVFNLVPAGRESGDYLVRHAGIDKVAFTGSTAAGKHIAAVCAERLARVSLELGGKSAAILLDDADFKAALPTLDDLHHADHRPGVLPLTRVLVPEARKQEFLDLSSAPSRASRLATRSIRRPTWGRSPWRASSKGAGLHRGGPGRGRAHSLRRRPAQPRQGLLHRAHGVHRRAARDEDRPGGDFRPRGLGHRLPRRGRCHRRSQRLRLRSRRRGLHERPGARLSRWRGGCARAASP